MEPLISILIPAYNAEAWISATISSALEQTWKRKEIIIVDDGSKDATLSVAKRFAGKEVSVLTQENSGASAARNRALSASQGDYIQWLDADDLLAPEKIAKQWSAAEQGDTKTMISSSWGRFYHRPAQAKFSPNALWRDLSPVEWLQTKMSQDVWMPTQSWLVSRDLTDSAGAWDETLSYDDDGEYFSRLISLCDKVRFVAEAQSYVRRGSPGSVSSEYNLSAMKLRSQLRSMERQIRSLITLDASEESHQAGLTYLQNWLRYFYPEHPELVNQMKYLAAELGGELRNPELNWKYGLVFRLWGWNGVKQARQILSRTKMSVSMLTERRSAVFVDRGHASDSKAVTVVGSGTCADAAVK